jgi:hypothetical protein
VPGYWSEDNVSDERVAGVDLYIATGRQKHGDRTFRSRPERRDARESPSRSFSCLCTCVQKYECLDSRLPGRW